MIICSIEFKLKKKCIILLLLKTDIDCDFSPKNEKKNTEQIVKNQMKRICGISSGSAQFAEVIYIFRERNILDFFKNYNPLQCTPQNMQ